MARWEEGNDSRIGRVGVQGERLVKNHTNVLNLSVAFVNLSSMRLNLNYKTKERSVQFRPIFRVVENRIF